MIRSFFIGLLAGMIAVSADKDEERIYSPTGKRDPFRAQSLPGADREVASLSELEKYAVEQYQLRAILRTDRRATALFEDPNGKTHIVDEGQMIGRERASVSRILEREVILTIQTRNYLGSEKLYEKHMALPEK